MFRLLQAQQLAHMKALRKLELMNMGKHIEMVAETGNLLTDKPATLVVSGQATGRFGEVVNAKAQCIPQEASPDQSEEAPGGDGD
jgi:hypothetical protein